eukprot:TRINITY_DN30241_c0_g1_i2.p1 TRINITY_DN30241_c0_g1~~TRINITY_DN30241_c0_g1_i2.p1  ORF type:complete len:242 (-),score=27.44 TRINITY_DN30241_c0_g1_i2:34-759(-)
MKYCCTADCATCTKQVNILGIGGCGQNREFVIPEGKEPKTSCEESGHKFCCDRQCKCDQATVVMKKMDAPCGLKNTFIARKSSDAATSYQDNAVQECKQAGFKYCCTSKCECRDRPQVGKTGACNALSESEYVAASLDDAQTKCIKPGMKFCCTNQCECKHKKEVSGVLCGSQSVEYTTTSPAEASSLCNNRGGTYCCTSACECQYLWGTGGCAKDKFQYQATGLDSVRNLCQTFHGPGAA